MNIRDRYPRAHFIDQSKRNIAWRGSDAKGTCEVAESAALDDATIDYTGGVTIEDGVHFGHEVMVLTCTHPVEVLNGVERRKILLCESVTIKQHAYIGSRATILPGVTIGKSSYIAAGAVVTKDVPERELWGGVPATRIRPI